MHEVELRRAALNLDHALRALPFAEGTHTLAPGVLAARYPVDLGGRRDRHYLVYDFAGDLPACYLHEKAQSVAAHARLMSRDGVTPGRVNEWVAGLRAASAAQETKIRLPLRVTMFRGLWYLLQPLLFLLFLISHLREGLPMKRFAERLGRDVSPPGAGPTIWLHAASLGEIKQLRPIIHELARCTDATILVTSFTKSSAAWLVTAFPDVVHRYAVMDGHAALRRFLDRWKPEVVIIAENEIWPEMIIQSARRGALLLKIGVRPSRTLHRFPKIAKTLLDLFSKLTCTSPALKEALVRLGVERQRVVICADQRDTGAILPVDETALHDIARQLAGRRLWLAASTHEADHAIVLDAHARLTASDDRLLILAPRHPRSAEAIKKICRQKGLVVAQRSRDEGISPATRVYLADTFGELGLFFSLCPVVFLGGGIGGEGGHNPYEPASFGCEILSGPHVANFSDAFASIATKTKVTFVETATQLAAEIVAHEASHRARPKGHSRDHAADPFQPEVADVVMAAMAWYRPALITRNEAPS